MSTANSQAPQASGHEAASLLPEAHGSASLESEPRAESGAAAAVWERAEFPCESCKIGVEYGHQRRARLAVTMCLECGMKLCREHGHRHFTAGRMDKLHCENLAVANDIIDTLIAEAEGRAGEMRSRRHEGETPNAKLCGD